MGGAEAEDWGRSRGLGKGFDGKGFDGKGFKPREEGTRVMKE